MTTTSKRRSTAAIGRDLLTAYDDINHTVREAAADRVRADYLALLKENAELRILIGSINMMSSTFAVNHAVGA